MTTARFIWYFIFPPVGFFQKSKDGAPISKGDLQLIPVVYPASPACHRNGRPIRY
jgi:hypothetical protein